LSLLGGGWLVAVKPWDGGASPRVAGLALAAAGAALGALLGFLTGRLLGRNALRPVLRSAAVAPLERRLSERPFTSVLMLRLLPVMPFVVVNLGAAFSRMRWQPFAVATLVGTLPGNAAYVLAGATAFDPTSLWLWMPLAACLAVSGRGSAAHPERDDGRTPSIR
jgi:uncharacterized membrane protein YdjX (TVP38/TMEM64 family)